MERMQLAKELTKLPKFDDCDDFEIDTARPPKMDEEIVHLSQL